MTRNTPAMQHLQTPQPARRCGLLACAFVAFALTLVCSLISQPAHAQTGDTLAFDGTSGTLSFSAVPMQSSEDLFAGYVDAAFGVSQDTDGIAPMARPKLRRDRLNDQEKRVYDILKARIGDVAAGREASAAVDITLADVGLKDVYTAADLGLSSVFDPNAPGTVSDEARQAFNALFTVGKMSVMYALMGDMPYELYWFDKTVGISYAMPQLGAIDNGHGGAIIFEDGGKFTFSLAVIAAYSKGGGQGGYEADVSKTGAAAAAAANARGIVDTSAALSDYDKLRAYGDAIVELTDYNYAIVEEYELTGVYGDAWQLIWVFDGDASTKVVCEGYSKAFQYLCDMSSFADASIQVNCLTGDMYAGTGDTTEGWGPHMFNVVKVGQRNYLVDLTNSDTVVANPAECASAKNGELFMAGADGDPYSGYSVSWPNETPGQGDNWIAYSYDAEVLSYFDEDEITLSEQSYLADVADDAKPKISVSVTVLGDAFHRAGERHTYASGNLQTWVSATALEVPEDYTALRALSRALRDAGYSGTLDGSGAITRIEEYGGTGNAIGNGANGEHATWEWLLNGAHVDATLAETPLAKGDELVLYYTDDWRFEAQSGVTVASVAVLGDACHGEDGTVHTLAGGGLAEWLAPFEVELSGTGHVALDALRAACSQEGFELVFGPEGESYIAEVRAPDGASLGEFDNATFSGWKYTLNGEYPSVAAAEQPLKCGDAIVLHYTDDWRIDDAAFDAKAHEALLAYLAAVNALPGGDVLALADGAKPTAAQLAAAEDAAAAAGRVQAAFDALPTADRAFVGSATAQRAGALADAAARVIEASMSDEARAQAVSALIDAIGKVAFSPACKAAIDAAQAGYDRLSDAQKALVGNASALVNAQTRYASLEKKARGTADAQGAPGSGRGKAGTAAPVAPSTITVNVKTVTAKTLAAAMKAAGTDAAHVTTITLGPKVKAIKAKAFSKCKKATTLVLKTKKLVKKRVRGCLKGSKVKTVKVPKKKRKAYKKLFTKKVAGKKVKVK